MTGTPSEPGVPAAVRLEDLRVGDLLAEGGEGQVFQLPRQPHLVYKVYRRPGERDHLEGLVDWPVSAATDEIAARVRSASAWPCSVVSDDCGAAVGLLMPRAPRRFALRHRDGNSRLASLSYLTADPGHRAVAYGLTLPDPVSPERVGLVYALARLLAAFETPIPSVGHGDLSTKNVLWSLQRGPEVFVIDCDSSERYGPDGKPLRDDGRRRAMTPNWDDPAVPRGQNPTPESDRYSLALIFLRVVGAANFPIQARQRGGDRVEVEFPVPPGPRSDVLLDPAAPVWGLCARGLSLADPPGRPSASEWVAVLESVLSSMGATALMQSVSAAQGGVPPSTNRPPAAGGVVTPPGASPAAADVVVYPVRAIRPERTWSKVSPAPRYGPVPQPAAPRPIGYRWAPVGPPPARLPAASAQTGLPSPAAPSAGASTVRGWTPNAPAAPYGAPGIPAPPGPSPSSPVAPSRPGSTARSAPAARSATATGAAPATGSAPARRNAHAGPASGTVPAGASGLLASGAPVVGGAFAATGGPPASTMPTPVGAREDFRAHAARFARWWRGIHRAMVQALLTPGRRWRALRSLVFCAAVDLALIVVVAAVVALIVSPITQG